MRRACAPSRETKLQNGCNAKYSELSPDPCSNLPTRWPGGFFGLEQVGNSTFTITAIPEPSTNVAAIALLALMLWPLRLRLRVK